MKHPRLASADRATSLTSGLAGADVTAAVPPRRAARALRGRRPASRKLAALLVIAAGLSACSHGRARPVANQAGTLLSCRDSAGQQPSDPAARPLNGVESAAWLGDTNSYDALPAWRSRDGRCYLVWKTYLAVAPGARPYRVIAVRPGPRPTLDWPAADAPSSAARAA